MKKKLLSIIALFILAVTFCALGACDNNSSGGGTPPAYTQDVTFVVLGEDGANDEIIYVDSGDVYRNKITMPTDPEKKGYEFKGWYTDKDVWSNKISQNYLYNVLFWNEDDSDIIVYAKFDIITYSITYKIDDYFAEVGEAANNITSYTVKTQFTLKNPTVRESSTTFVGWYDGDTEVAVLNNTIGNLTLTAKFTSTVPQYTREGTTSMLFGSYPQSEVTATSDASLKAELDALFENETPSTNNGWTVQLNYANSAKTTIILHKDFWHEGARYRAIYFSKYRPANLANDTNAATSNQDDNGYTTGNVYFFKYEPIRWQVVDGGSGASAWLFSEKVLDSREMNLGEGKNNPGYNGSNASFYQGFDGVYWNWFYSWARYWLKYTFIDTAFNYIQYNTHMDRTSVSNTGITAGYAEADAVTAHSLTTNNYVYFFSNQEIKQHYATDASRKKQPTDYAKAMGVTVVNGYSPYWLRSAVSTSSSSAEGLKYAQTVDSTGALSSALVHMTNIGFAPVIAISEL